jgi:PAS domain S-box-containing protein
VPNHSIAAPDFRALFDAAPAPYLILSTQLSIVEVNQAYLRVTHSARERILGRNIFDVFPDNPADPAADGVAKLRASLMRVLNTKTADTMAVQKHDLLPSGPDETTFEERYWSAINTPVVDASGTVSHIIHHVEDVTDFVRAKDHVGRMESEVCNQALEIQVANRRLREANDELEARVLARTAAERQAEGKLRESEQRFRLMADSIPQMVWIVNDAGRAVYFNKQWVSYTGAAPLASTTPEQISTDFVHPDDQAATMQSWHLARRTGQVYSLEHRLRGVSGEYRWFLVRAEPYQDPDSGKIVSWFGTSTDVHDRKLAEAALRASEERYRTLFDSIDEGFCIIEVLFDELGRACDYRFSETNPSFEQQTGLVNAVGKTMRELAPAHEAHWYEIYGHVHTTGQASRFENEAKALNRWFDVFAFRIRDAETHKVAILFKDITEQKRLTETLRHSEHAAITAARQAEAERQRLDAVLQAAPVGIVVSEANGAILLANAAHRSLWGPQHPKTQSIEQFGEWRGWWADHSERHGRPLLAHEWATARILRGEENPRDLVTIESFDTPPVQRTVLITGAPIKGSDGAIVGAVVAQMDISDRVRSEDALLQADRRKDEFLAMLAHELRNPLAPISAAADLLGTGRLNETRIKQTSGVIARQVKHMVGLVDDLLDVSRVTRGLAQLDKTKLDAKKILSDAVEQVRPLIEARGHRLAVHTPPESTFVLGDAKRLVQILANLLNNAAKYTPEGGNIVLGMEVSGGQIRIAVTDNGVGMTPELKSRAFELFAQAARTSDRSQGGLGIGLALVKSLVALHGGSVCAHSEGLGHGSRFEVCLPHLAEEEMALANAESHGQHVAVPRNPLKMMVVDDNADAAEMLAMFIEAMGHRVIVEHSPHKAIQRARDEMPDVCLLDIGLPGMDGNELARRLKSQPETAQALLIAVTGYGQEQDRELAMSAGFSHHFAKPVDSAKLTDLLERLDRGMA